MYHGLYEGLPSLGTKDSVQKESNENKKEKEKKEEDTARPKQNQEPEGKKAGMLVCGYICSLGCNGTKFSEKKSCT